MIKSGKVFVIVAVIATLVMSMTALASQKISPNHGWVYACGNGVCEVGEDCEWNGKLGRQMLCDGSHGKVPSNKACSACRLYAGCGNGICDRGEQCEWSGDFGRQFMCDGKHSKVPSDMKCASCKVYPACWK